MTLVAMEHIGKDMDDCIRVEWNMGKRCNHDCSYCSPDLHDNTSPHLTIEVMKRTVDRIMAAYEGKKVRIALTGGEPFVNPRIHELLAHMYAKGVWQVGITSNGSLPPRAYIKAMEYVNNFVISYHPEFVREDNFRKVVFKLTDEVERFKVEYPDKWRHVHVHVMMLPDHFEQCKALIEWMKEHGISHAIRRIRPLMSSDGGLNRPYMSGMTGQHLNIQKGEGPANGGLQGYYSDDELAYLGVGSENNPATFNNAIEHRVLEGAAIMTRETNVNKILMNQENGFKGWTCWAGLQTLQIYPDGTIYRASCRVGGPIGNVNDDFELPTEPVQCTKLWCNCAADINISKHSKGFRSALRLAK